MSEVLDLMDFRELMQYAVPSLLFEPSLLLAPLGDFVMLSCTDIQYMYRIAHESLVPYSASYCTQLYCVFVSTRSSEHTLRNPEVTG